MYYYSGMSFIRHTLKRWRKDFLTCIHVLYSTISHTCKQNASFIKGENGISNITTTLKVHYYLFETFL